jgi:hypothetical protein
MPLFKFTSRSVNVSGPGARLIATAKTPTATAKVSVESGGVPHTSVSDCGFLT